ncbi:MAG: HAD-IIA family hydrolase [Massilibacteroides sp.]|nr:HAD-IIA family hydrolase [Massilibacteroides sp.]MDD3063423.1 HAD-IIA family hydrolase [Massilibacteroides sp.]MDD4114139.1 HAD-IIA family hydrolase [Massilibacteroides sp.]MDD4660472.1 HAD-IIA family hydrolase [Massilibacteroides sp.]
MTIDNLTELQQRLRKVKHVALDMDGTIYKGETLFPFTIPFLNELKEMQIRYSFLTNNPSKSTDDYLSHLRKMGIEATKEEMYTSAQATVDYLKNHFPEMKRLFILGTPSMVREFEQAGFISTSDNPEDEPDGVVIGFDRSLVYPRLCRAAWWIQKGMPYIATNPDKVCPTDLPVTLVDCGSICSCIEKAVGRKPDVVIGKPDPRMLDGILKRYGLQPEEVAMVGDRIYTDIQLAKNAGVLGVLILTGEAMTNDLITADFYPDILANDLSELGELLREAKAN